MKVKSEAVGHWITILFDDHAIGLKGRDHYACQACGLVERVTARSVHLTWWDVEDSDNREANIEPFVIAQGAITNWAYLVASWQL